MPKHFPFGDPTADGQVKVSIDEPYLKAHFVDLLRTRRALTQSTLTPSVIEVPAKDFLAVLLQLASDGFELSDDQANRTRADLVAEFNNTTSTSWGARSLAVLRRYLPVGVELTDGVVDIVHTVAGLVS